MGREKKEEEVIINGEKWILGEEITDPKIIERLLLVVAIKYDKPVIYRPSKV